MNRPARASLLHNADFLRFWGAQTGSAFGSRITRTALPIIAILSLHASPSQVALLSALGVAPGVAVGLLAAGRVDRAAKRPLLIGADLVRALLILTIPAAAWLGTMSMTQLCLVAAAAGAATTVFDLADNSFLPSLVGAEHVLEGNARLAATDSVAEMAGPGAAGVLIQLLTAPIAVIIDALSYLWSALLLSRIRALERVVTASADPPTVIGDIATGLRACRSHPIVRRALVAEWVMYLFGGFFLALYMILLLETLQLSPATAGLIIGVGGVGALGGAMIARRLEMALGTGRAMLLAIGVGQASKLLIAFAPHLPSLAVTFLVLQQLVGDAFLGAYLIHSVSLRQRALPHDVLARAGATFHVATGVALPAGALIAGPLAGLVGVPTAIWIGTIGGLLAVPLLAARSVIAAR